MGSDALGISLHVGGSWGREVMELPRDRRWRRAGSPSSTLPGRPGKGQVLRFLSLQVDPFTLEQRGGRLKV